VLAMALCNCASEPSHPQFAPTVVEAAHAPAESVLDLNGWQLVPGQSGVNYYTIVHDAPMPFIRARYRPSHEAVSLAYSLDDQERKAARLMRWRWRALRFPEGGRACEKGHGDFAASVYVTWKRGLRWYSLKYAWSTGVPKGTTCQDRRGLFVAQDTIVRASGGPLNTWREEEIDLAREYREHFEDGSPDASVPELMGIGILTDGDQTGTSSEADYGAFVIVR